jgi:2-methylcitrate dehydratase PrpD
MRDIGGCGASTVIPFGYKVPFPFAALANGMMTFILEIDDGHRPSDNHIGSTVISSALAVGEMKKASGKDLILAAVVGCEAAGRVGVAVLLSPLGLRHTGFAFHGSGTSNTFGGAAAAGKILALDKEAMMSAFGIAGTEAAGLIRAWKEPIGDACLDFIKPFHPGKAAENGTLAAFLAEKGFRGSPTILESFCDAITTRARPEKCVENLGNPFEVMRDSFKVHSTCGACFSAIDATLKIVKENDIKPEDIVEVIIRETAHSVENAQHHVYPKSEEHARMNTPYAVAVAIMDRQAFIDQFTEERIADPKVQNMFKKIRHIADQELDKIVDHTDPFWTWPASVTIKTGDGREYTKTVLHPKGYHPSNPMTREEVENKFIMATSKVFNKAKAMELISLVRRLETVDNINKLIQLTVV